MTASSWPTTLAAPAATFPVLSEGTYAGRNRRPRTATAGSPLEWGVPANADECERVLRTAEASEMTEDLAEYLAGFLGVGSHVWTALYRTRLRLILARAGMSAVPMTLAAVARTPREEVIDDAIDVLVDASRRDARVLPALSKAFPMRSQDDRDALLEHASVRAAIARVLGSVRERGTRDARLRALAVALTDPGAEVRDAAIRALTSFGDPAAQPLLAERLRSEPEQFLRDEIEQSLDELRGE
jgi:hypothetical protein